MKKKSAEEYKREVLTLTDSEYECIGDYINNKTPVKMYHAVCRNTFDMKPNKFLSGHRCPICNKMRKKSIMEVRRKVLEQGHDLFLLSEYTDMKTPATFVHTECGRTFLMKPADAVRGRKCPFCSDKISGKSERFQSKLSQKFPEILLTEQYKSDNKKIQFICRDCKSRFLMKPKDILEMTKCPGCIDKEIAERIGVFLEKAEIPFRKNEEFFNGALMSFNYYLPDFNIAIDYAGELYYDNLKNITSASNDKYKQELRNQYCKKHKIKYLQIPFWKADEIYTILYDLFMNITEKSSFTTFKLWKRAEKLGSYKSFLRNKKCINKQ